MMQDFPIRNIFMPAVLVAGSMFSLLTLPALLKQATNNTTEASSPSQAADFELGQSHKDIVIPYIGTAIILSTGVGIGTAELARKRCAARSAQAVQPSSLSKAIASNLETAMQIDIEPAEVNLLSPESAAWPEAETKFKELRPEQLLSKDASCTVVVFPGQYRRCRIQVPPLQTQVYAIEFDQQLYSLLSAGISKTEAIGAIEQLAKTNRAAILTRMNQGYAVWVLEPQGFIDKDSTVDKTLD
ncbi:MAG: hypothetical protein HC886_17505 [Leptolyngbyaceae cyanobacterium SM1_1_3]|nr:hypothetical protein [Leptolyngbyaceae cyanobacterium SM1_1_3]NJN01534.1 hypothetical protein [Leptolyngbyaceae cyanobacterium RM1_1_2]NJO08658.1 hypothetical protein [Leptolyngbyaceae cyanobacterium SL_1_1]